MKKNSHKNDREWEEFDESEIRARIEERREEQLSRKKKLNHRPSKRDRSANRPDKFSGRFDGE